MKTSGRCLRCFEVRDEWEPSDVFYKPDPSTRPAFAPFSVLYETKMTLKHHYVEFSRMLTAMQEIRVNKTFLLTMANPTLLIARISQTEKCFY